MYQAFAATIDPAGNVHLDEALPFVGPRRAVVVILDEATATALDETALLSEEALAESWNRPEEDAAWAYLQSEK